MSRNWIGLLLVATISCASAAAPAPIVTPTEDQTNTAVIGTAIGTPTATSTPTQTPASIRVQVPSWSIYANPKADGTILTLFDYIIDVPNHHLAAANQSIAAGSDHLYEILDWDALEPAVGVYSGDALLDRFVAQSGELPLWLNIAPIGTDGTRNVPAALVGTAWDDAAMRTAFKNLLTHLQPRLKNRLYILIVGNEADNYFTAHPSEIAAYGTFLNDIRTHARTLFGTNPFKVTTSFTFRGSAQWATTYAPITSVTDLEAVTYYYVGTSGIDSALADFATVNTRANGPYIYQEIGFPSGGGAAGSSLEAQYVVTTYTYNALAGYAQPTRLLGATWFTLEDYLPDVLTSAGYVTPYLEIFASTGLRNTSDVAKPSYIILCQDFGGTNCGEIPAPSCTYTIAATSRTFTAALGSDTVALTASGGGCAWTREILDGAPSWLTVTPASGVGNATITYSVTANTGTPSRSARFTIGDGDIFTITQDGATPPDPNPSPDPVLPCNSTTPSPTQRTPVMRWTSCRQDTWNHMYADYLINPANPPTQGGKWMKLMKDNADCDCRYWDIGQFDAFMYQVTGNPGYAAGAYAKLAARLADSGPFALGTPANTDQNMPRVEGAHWTYIFDWIYNGLSASEKANLTSRIAAQLEYGTTSNVGLRQDDTDQNAGLYFAVVAFHLLLPNDARATALFNSPDMGGLVPVVPSTAFNTPEAGTTRRDALQWYVQVRAEGGEWFESAAYDLGTPAFVMEGADAVRTATGIDYFPEVTAWMPHYGERLLGTITPDLKEVVQWGDESDPHTLLVDRKFAWTIAVGITQGMLHGTAIARRLQSQLNALIALYGYCCGDATMEPKSQVDAGAMFTYFNPYETADDWTASSRAFVGRGTGLLTYRSGFAATDSLFQVHYGRSANVTTGSHLGETSLIDHHVYYCGDFMLYRQHESVIDHPFAYDGPPTISGEGANAMLVHGIGTPLEYQANNFMTASDATHGYAAGTCGGGAYPLPFFEIPRVSTHEQTREVLYVPGTTDTVITYDRVNATGLLDSSHYAQQLYYIGMSAGLSQQAPATKLYTFHTPVSPTIVGNAITWSTPVTAQTMKWTTLLPAASTKSIVNETTMTSCVSISSTSDPTNGCVKWHDSHTMHASQLKYHVKIAPSTEQQWDTFLNVFQAGTSGAVTLKQANGAEGAHVTRPGQADLLAIFNGTQGTTLALAAYDPTHVPALDVVRFRGVGYGPIAWSAVTASTLVYLYDLDPHATWTLAIDGGAPGAIVPAASGEYATTIAGIGSHSITTVGSGSAPPPDPVTCPTITLAPTTLPSGTTGSAYAQAIVASGGTGPYTYTITTGTLPTGLSLATNGNLTGTPTIAGDYTFTVKASQADFCLGTQAYTLAIDAAPTTDLARVGTAQTIYEFSGSASSVTGTVTVSAGTNTLGVVEAIGGGGVDQFSGCTLGGGAMTVINKIQAPGDLWLYTLRRLAPGAGSVALTCTWSGVQGTTLAAVYHQYVNVNQTTPIDVSGTFTSTGATTIPATLTTTQTNVWTVLAARSWGTATAGLAANDVGACCGLAVFDFGPRGAPGLKQMEGTYPSPVLYGAVMFAINPAP